MVIRMCKHWSSALKEDFVDLGLKMSQFTEVRRFGGEDLKTIPPSGGVSHTRVRVLCVCVCVFVLGSPEIVFSAF